MTWHNNLKIRGITGWSDAEREKSKGSVVMEALQEEVVPPEKVEQLAKEAAQWDNREIDPKGWKDAPEALPSASMPMSTPEERLAALQKDLREGGNIIQAPAETGGFVIQWSSDKGFGELTIVMRKDGTIRIDNEGDSRSALLELLTALLDQGTLVDEPDPSLQH